MAFVFSLWDLALWLAASALVMLVASELFAPYLGRRKTFLLDVKKLRIVAVVFSLAFILTVGIRIMTVANG
jgi:hypothetical protein